MARNLHDRMGIDSPAPCRLHHTQVATLRHHHHPGTAFELPVLPGTSLVKWPQQTRRAWLLTTAQGLSALALGAAVWPVHGAAGSWADQRDAGPYRIRSEFPLSELPELIPLLADLEVDLAESLALEFDHTRPIHLYLFRTRYQYTQYLAQRQPAGSKRPALYVPGTDAGRVYLYRHAGLEVDLRHEVTHALLRQALPYVPIWLDEGLAEYHEIPAAQRETGHEHERAVRWSRRFGWKPRLKQLEGLRSMTDMDGKAYRDSWAVVHYLLHDSETSQDVLRAYLQEIRSGEAPTPISTALATALGDPERRIAEHFR